MPRPKKKRSQATTSGKLRIGDDWNAITIIALSQSNPLKAVAEFVENSIDARARHVVITRGRERGEHYLRIQDDGEGIPRDADGVPDFRYVATHIGDSIKRHRKAEGARGIQGEFGIGLLSFWTVGEALFMTSAGEDGRTWQMLMRKGDPAYEVVQRRTLIPERGAELMVKPLLPGIRHFSGEKMQWYLASELRDRIRQSGVRIDIVDRHARKQYRVEPRQFTGRLLHQLGMPKTSQGDVYLELYLAEPSDANRVGLYRAGTRVLADIAELDAFRCAPWTGGYLQGIVDADFLNLTPGTRSGIIQDASFVVFRKAMLPFEAQINVIIDAQRKAEEERASRQMLRTIQKAFREALLALPSEEYDWFDIHKSLKRRDGAGQGTRAGDGTDPGEQEAESASAAVEEAGEGRARDEPQKQFFEYAGPLYSVQIAPASSVLAVDKSRTLRAIARDRSRRLVEHDLRFGWRLIDGAGRLEGDDREIATFHAPGEPGLARLEVTVTQGDVSVSAEAMITITDSLLPEAKDKSANDQGLPGYTFRRAPGELWRSRYDAEQNLIVINNGHRDFVYASRNRALKLRYICRLFAKEMVCRNFPGQPTDELLERMIELSMYTEEHLR
ncbi:hypothetical protein BH24PSE2_BH24PSE2_07370 [soil metagenome]